MASGFQSLRPAGVCRTKIATPPPEKTNGHLPSQFTYKKTNCSGKVRATGFDAVFVKWDWRWETVLGRRGRCGASFVAAQSGFGGGT